MFQSNLQSPVLFCPLNLNHLSKDLLEECASVYCRIWKEPPWNEDFWTVPGVMDDLRREMAKDGASGFLSLSEKERLEVVGFTWGYRVDAQQLAELASNSEIKKFFDPGEVGFYIDELGVAPDYRERDIGKSLTKLLLGRALLQGVEKIFLRTDRKAVAARSVYSKLGFRELSLVDGVYDQRNYWALIIR
ncbi:MAG TPA: GNAT family N-acetyltransferase [Patescibacteria group bacterium]|nr:GNAT family N-acetyltransferase [Patescibacteria group bacterium]